MSTSNIPVVFISYAREDIEVAIRLTQDLRRYGITTWFDKDNLRPGQMWRSAIKNWIRKSTHFVTLISRNSINKEGYVQKELLEALSVREEKPPSSPYIIPVRLDDSVPQHQILSEITWVDLFIAYDEGVRAIVQAVIGDSPIHEQKAFTNQTTILLGTDIQTTSIYSDWFTRICWGCKSRFREGDRVRLCPQCGKAYHDDERSDFRCFEQYFSSGEICTQKKYDPITEVEIHACTFRLLGRKVLRNDPEVGRLCPWCRFDIRAGDWIVGCPCGSCETCFHEDIFAGLTCWSGYKNGGGEYCPTSGLRLG